MGEVMKKYIFTGAVLILIIAAGFLLFKGHGTSESDSEQKLVTQEKEVKAKVKEKKELPLDLSLRFIQGVEGQNSLLKIRMFSRQLLQKEIDNRLLSEGDKKDIEPVVISLPEGFWKEGILAVISEKKPEHDEIKLKFINGPEEPDLTFTPGKIYEALYEIPSSVVLASGTQLWVETVWQDHSIRSNSITVPELPVGEKETLVQEARVFMNLVNTDELLVLADELISMFPKDSTGYLLKGMALEIGEDEEGALKNYEQALKIIPPSGQEGNVEPPLHLVQKIKELKKRLKKH